MSLMVGVSGIRGLVGTTLTPSVVLEFAQAYGTLLEGGRVILGRDSRPSGEMFSSAAAAGLLSAGCEVTEIGVVMTPAAGHAVIEGKYDGGVVITASHNPPGWNGLKFLDERGLAPDPERAKAVARIRAEGAFAHRTEGHRAIAHDIEAGERHLEAVLERVEADTQPLQGLHVVLDSVNGAGCQYSPGLLTALGCELTHLNGEPTGEFAHLPEPIEANLGELCAAVRESGAQVGFAQDPDADRLAIVDEQGRYIGEEYTLVLAAWSMLRRRPGPVAATLSTSRMIDDVAQRFNVAVHRTPVGEAHVARAMMDHGCVVGGEGNGGVVDLRVCPIRDSLTAMSLVLQLMAETGKTLSALVSEIPRYASIKQKFECSREKIDQAVERVIKAFGDEQLNTSDGVRIDFADGWVHLRASNTEPIVRILCEAEEASKAEGLIERVRQAADL